MRESKSQLFYSNELNWNVEYTTCAIDTVSQPGKVQYSLYLNSFSPDGFVQVRFQSWVVHKLNHVVRLIKLHSAVHLRIDTTLQVRLSQSATMRACLTMSSRKMKLISPTTWRKSLREKRWERVFTTNVLFAISCSRLATLTEIQTKRLHGKWQRMVTNWQYGVSTGDWPGRFVVHRIGC